MVYFSKTTRGFYLESVHGAGIPADAVEITSEEHAALLAAEASGKRIEADQNGYPIAVEPTLAEIKAAAWNKIKAERDRRKSLGVKVGTDWFHSDDASRIQQLGLVMMGANMPAGIQWKTLTAGGSVFVEMTPTLAQGIFNAVAAYDQAVFAAAEAHRVAMEASADPSTYDLSAGWPVTFE